MKPKLRDLAEPLIISKDYGKPSPLLEAEAGDVPLPAADGDAVTPDQTDDFTCTVTEAIAWLAYGDEKIAARYGATVDAADDEGWRRRLLDKTYLDSIVASGLPGTEAVRGLSGKALIAGVRVWQREDDQQWAKGHNRLMQALREGVVRTFDKDGEMPSGRWVKRRPSKYERAGYRIHRGDLRRLVSGEPEIDNAPAAPKLAFNKAQATFVLAGMKRGGVLTERPTPSEAQGILDKTFRHSPRDPVIGIIRKLWGEGKRGPRNPRNRAAKL